jgi:zinc protease
MKAEFKKLCDELVSQEELDRAKRYLIGNHDIVLQKTSSIASAILYNEVYGIDHKEIFNVAELYNPITVQDIQDLAIDIFSKNEVISLVGPSNPF